MKDKDTQNSNVQVSGRITADTDMDTFAILVDINKAIWALKDELRVLNRLKAYELFIADKTGDATTESFKDLSFYDKLANGE
jgi:hypothetical protein